MGLSCFPNLSVQVSNISQLMIEMLENMRLEHNERRFVIDLVVILVK